MKEFVLIFRMDILDPSAQPTAEQMKVYMQDWMQWIGNISSKQMMGDGGNHLLTSGKVLRPDNVMTDGPYEANKESVAGYIIVNCRDMDEAIFIAKNCPILKGSGTSVEVRETAAM